MATAIFDRNHVATTPDEKAIERGFASSVGFIGGIAFTLAACGLTGTIPSLFNPTVFLMAFTSIPLGIIAANQFLTSDAPAFPVLEMMRYAIIALPLVLLTEVLLGSHALGMMGDFIGSAPMVGARFLIALVAAAGTHALANLAVWDEPSAEAEAARPTVDWQKRYVDARGRLASTTVDTRRAREREEAELAEFDRRLAATMGSEEVVFEVVEETAEARATA
jgi:hypothetical protein